MQRKDIKSVLEKIHLGSYSPEEETIAKYWLHQLNLKNKSGYSDQDLGRVSEEMWHLLMKEEVLSPPVKVKLWPRIVAVAAAVAIIVSGVYFFNYRSDKEDLGQHIAAVRDIAPGKMGATLTLANGKMIKLVDAAAGEIAKQAGISVTKTAGGELVYEINPSLRKDTITPYNTLSTAKGETYILILPDQSKVWMNAASSLTYSAVLNEHGKRRVKLRGEAYFEIAKDKAHPFIVESAGQEVEVLGTHFNINAYPNEPVVRTTLLEGSVAVTLRGGKQPATLRPGQQAILEGNVLQVAQADTELALAWKNGYFQFEGENLESIMRKVSRWYDVDVEYKDNSLKTLAFVGTVSKYKNVSQVLKKLQLTNALDFKLLGRTIVISRGNK